MRLIVAALLLAAPAWAAGEITPLRGQDSAQQMRDLEACQAQATQKSGHDPAKPPPGMVAEAVKGAAAGAAAGVVGGGVTSGAASGAASAAMRQRSENAARLAAYDKERTGCLTSRGYRVTS